MSQHLKPLCKPKPSNPDQTIGQGYDRMCTNFYGLTEEAQLIVKALSDAPTHYREITLKMNRQIEIPGKAKTVDISEETFYNIVNLACECYPFIVCQYVLSEDNKPLEDEIIISYNEEFAKNVSGGQYESETLHYISVDDMQMVFRKTAQEFRDTGLMVYINQILHVFGWAIVVDVDTGEMYPARVKFRGFSEDAVSKSYVKISHWMKDSADKLLAEAEE